jgi:hypothetical protein
MNILLIEQLELGEWGMPEAKKLRRRTIALVVDTLAGSGSYQEDIWRTVAEACRRAGAGSSFSPAERWADRPSLQTNT